MPKSPVCANTQLPQQPPPQAPSKSPQTEVLRETWQEIERTAGVLAPSQVAELRLQQVFSEAFVGLLNARLQAPGKNGGLDQLLAERLGWKRWLWQKESATTAAGGVRQALLERGNRAEDLIRTYTQFEALPIIRELEGVAKAKLEPLVGAAKAQELLYDHVVVGSLLQLRNISDSEAVANVVYQRYLKHYNQLQALDPTLELTEALDAVSRKLLESTDDLAQLARSSGVKIDTLGNGGYFPNVMTPEFENYLRESNPQWLGGFKGIREKFQKTRLSSLPVVANVDEVTALLQGALLKKPLSAGAWTEYSAKELEVVEAAARKAQEAAEEVRSRLGVESLEQAADIEKTIVKNRKKAVASSKRILEAKDNETLEALRTKLEGESLPADEIKVALEAEKQKLAAVREQKYLDVEVRWQSKLESSLQEHFSSRAKHTEGEVAQVFAKQTAEVQQALDFNKAKLALSDLMVQPGAMAKFLHESFTPEKLQRLFDNGILASVPATSDELLEFYRSVDTGVRGLSDAILLNPVEAMKGYASELAKVAREQALFKTAFDEGTTAGWVVDVPPPNQLSQYMRVGDSPTLAKHLQESGMSAATGDLYIHKQVASALDSLMHINTSPSALASVSSTFQMMLRPFRRMMILGSGVGYITRVFLQNTIATYAATGSVAQLPLAMADTMRLLNKGFAGLPNTKQVFSVGGKSYNAKELFQAMLGARGGHSLASMQEPSELLEGSFRLFSKESSERARHFNELYTERFGEPLTGTLTNARNAAGEVFAASYRTLAFTNQFLDLTFRWATVRELASTREFRDKSFEELMRRTDEYFSINADAGSLGSFVGSFISPFAQFALNAPGSALRHAIRHPWRAGNVMTLYATASGSSGLSESELPEWLKESESYFMTVAKDPDTGKHFVVVPGSVAYLLDSYQWFGSLGRDLAGINSSTRDYTERLDNPFYLVQKHATEIAKKSYWWDLAAGAFNVDPNTLEKYSLGSDSDTVLGVPTTKGVRSLLMNYVPLLRTLERSLPASVVGQAPSTKLVADGNLRVVDNPGVPSLFGAVPTSGGASRDKGLPQQAKVFQLLTGLTVQDVDPQRNVIGSYKDLDTRLREVRTNRRALYTRLAQSGRAPVASEAARYQQLKDLEVVLLHNKFAIDQHALETGQTPPYVFERMQGKFEELLTQPLKGDTLRNLLEEYQSEQLP